MMPMSLWFMTSLTEYDLYFKWRVSRRETVTSFLDSPLLKKTTTYREFDNYPPQTSIVPSVETVFDLLAACIPKES